MQELHPLIAEKDTIEERGIAIISDIDRMPTYNEPYITRFMKICLNLQGQVNAEYDMRPITFQQHEVSVLLSNHIMCAQSSSEDYLAMLIAISPKFQKELKNRHPSTYINIQQYHQQASIQLNDEQFVTIRDLFMLMKRANQTDSPHRLEIMANMLEALFMLLSDYRLSNGIREQKPSAQEQMFERFYEAIIEHYRESREIQFYANLFALTPKYFATIIQKQTKLKASEWINGYVITQAKSLLLYRRDLTIQQIAFYLGFTEQSSFSRFFKIQTGQSPQAFRTGKVGRGKRHLK